MPRLDYKLWGPILKLAAPVILAMLTQTAINLMDTVMVGWLDPSYSIAGQSALGYSLPLLWSVGGFLSALSVGTQAISARRAGEEDYEKSGQILTNSLAIAFTAGATASIAAYLVVPLVFPLLNSNESVLAFGIPYARLRLLGVLSMVATISCKSFFDGNGKTHIHMVVAIIMNGLNILLNYLLIFGIGPFPRMNVEGAGLASLISTYVGLALIIGWTFLPKYAKKFRYYRASNLDRKIMFGIVRLSLPSGLATVFVMSGFLLFLKIVGYLDTLAVEETLSSISAYASSHAAHLSALQHSILDADAFSGRVFFTDLAQMSIEARPPIFTSATKVIIDVLSITFMSAMAFGTATATLVSQSLGRNEPEMAERYGWESVKLGSLIFGTIGLLTFIWPEQALGLLSRDEEVILAGVGAIRILAAIEWTIAAALILTQALFGAGNSKFVMYVEMSLHVICLVPLSYLLGITLDLGLPGVWSAAAAYIILLAAIMGWKFKGGSWKQLKI